MGSAVILARYIDAEEYGIYALMIAVYGIIVSFQDIGISAAYIKAPVVDENIRNAFFTINVLLGSLSSCMIASLGFLLSSFYGNDKFTFLMLIYSPIGILSCLSIQGYAELNRLKEFKKIALIDLLSSILSICIGVLCALSGLQILSLIFLALSLPLAKLLLLVVIHKFDYRFVGLNAIAAQRVHVGFGLKVFVGRLINGMNNSLDKLFLGKLISPYNLGQYRMPQQHLRLIDSNLRMPLTSVIYSYLERFDGERRTDSYFHLGVLLLIPMIWLHVIIFLYGAEVYVYVFGEKWIIASTYIKYLAFFSMGTVLKGVSTTLALLQNRVGNNNISTIVALGLQWIMLLFFYLELITLNNFVLLLSLTGFVLWSLVLLERFSRLGKKNLVLKYYLIYGLISLFFVYAFKILNGYGLSMNILLITSYTLSCVVVVIKYIINHVSNKEYSS